MKSLKKNLQKRFARFSLFLILQLDFYRRFSSQGITWRDYVKLFLNEQYRRNRKRMQIQERERMENEHWEPILIKEWLFDSSHLPPKYVCEECEGENTLTKYQAVRYKNKEGEISLIHHLFSICSVCGTNKIRHFDYGLRRSDQIFLAFENNASRYPTVYELSYSVTYGDHYSRRRRQVRTRMTHEYVDERAEPCDLGEFIATPFDISESNITEIHVDDVPLKCDGVLYRKLIPVILDYERARMKENAL